MDTQLSNSHDSKTAQAFATSWNNLPAGSVYTHDQFVDWMTPLAQVDFKQKTILELGCGNGSLLAHVAQWEPSKVAGVDLGDSVASAKANLAEYPVVEIKQGDLTTFSAPEPFDVVYCIGVLHHLKQPQVGFASVVRNTKPGGRFHCWVYAKEGNLPVRLVVEPVRYVTSRLPWWITKYFVATPLIVPFFLYAKLLRVLPSFTFLKHLPLYEYALWIGKRDFLFFRHVAFDQLVTPQTAYIARETIQQWLQQNSAIDQSSTYVIMRNGNSWKFGGQVKTQK